MRCILIPPAGEGWDVLPPNISPCDLFGRGSCLIRALTHLNGVGVVEFVWTLSHLTQAPNPAASSLTSAIVCGDCVAVVQNSRDAEGESLRAVLDAAVARGTSSAARSLALSESAHRPAGGKPPLLQALEACSSEAELAPPPSSGTAGGDACEPRTQLLWVLAGRATSMSWESSNSAARPRCEAVDPVQPPAQLEATPTGGHDAQVAGVASDPARCSSADSPWSALSPELTGHILGAAGYSVTLAHSFSQVSRAWRAALLEDRCTWQQLRFLRVSASDAGRLPAQALPWLVRQAAHAGNLSACLAAARLSEQSGAAERAAKYWTRAARLGHAEAQWRVGLAHYKGLLGQQLDAEEALLWLSRSAKQLVEVVEGGGIVPAGLPLLMTLSSCRNTLSQAAHILGILHLDGEGTKQDTQAAIFWLKTSRCCGGTEAGLMLNSLFRNGIY